MKKPIRKHIHKLKRVTEGHSGSSGTIPSIVQCSKCGKVWTLDKIGGLIEEELE